MSDKAVKETKNKPVSGGVKWLLGLVTGMIAISGTIVASVKITEMRGQADTAKLQNIFERLAIQNARIDALEELPAAIATTTRQLEAVSYGVNTLSDGFNRLNEEAGQNKVPNLVKKAEETNHRLKSLEEMQNNEALILSTALLIKENALYHLSFAHEASILSELAKGEDSISKNVEIINRYKNQNIADNGELVAQYKEAMAHFSFGNNEKETNDATDENMMVKGAKMLKNTVLGINFDRVVVLKKEKQTAEQKKLLAELDGAVAAYNFKKALDIITTHKELTAVENKGLKEWQENVRAKLDFDAALSHLISEQLSAFRQDVKKGEVKQPKKQQEISYNEVVNDENLPISENEEASND